MSTEKGYFDPQIALEQMAREEEKEQKKQKRKTLVQAFQTTKRT